MELKVGCLNFALSEIQPITLNAQFADRTEVWSCINQ